MVKGHLIISKYGTKQWPELVGVFAASENHFGQLTKYRIGIEMKGTKKGVEKSCLILRVLPP
ncbi:MAG: hypothetical protein ACKVT2_14910 [Saprospiraceae bacterium]